MTDVTNEPDNGVRATTLRLVHGYFSLLGEERIDEWADLWAADATWRFPYALPDMRQQFQGPAEMVAYAEARRGKIEADSVEEMRTCVLEDPTMALVEFGMIGRSETGRPYNQRFVLVFETADGKITECREYWNPTVSIESMGLEEWKASFEI